MPKAEADCSSFLALHKQDCAHTLLNSEMPMSFFLAVDVGKIRQDDFAFISKADGLLAAQ